MAQQEYWDAVHSLDSAEEELEVCDKDCTSAADAEQVHEVFVLGFGYGVGC